MNREEVTLYSRPLDRDMHLMVYGGAGVPLLAFPTQNSMCRNYEDFGMIHELADFIEEGKIQFFVPDTVDAESWSARGWDNAFRADRQEQYFRFVTEELVPYLRSRNPGAPVATGCSMGADHAVITFLRRPDLFRGVLALSGVYDADYFFDGWMNPTLYDNSPERFLPNMPADHPWIRLYNERKIILCCGQGAWDEDGVRTLRNLERIFREKGINAWCDFWGWDVCHDWPWWFKQMRYFLPFLLDEE